MENTSGQGILSEVPKEILEWNWGAFLLGIVQLGWMWGLNNRVKLALLTLIPVAGVIIAVMLGLNGSKWAWQNRQWDSIEEFKRIQKIWVYWGLAALPMLYFWLLFLIAIIIPSLSRSPG